MKTIRNISLACLLAVLSLLPVPVHAQASLTTTTLSAAVSADASASTVIVASATNVNAPALPFAQGGIGSPSTAALTWLYVDQEVMRVNGVSGTTVSVERGYSGTRVSAHASGATVVVAPASYFTEIDPPAGSPCVATQIPVLPRINFTNGNRWTCGNSKWTLFAAYQQQLTLGAVIASATTIAPTNPLFHVSGTTAVVNITVPPACPGNCQITIIPDGIFTTTNAGNIALASTAVVSKALIMTYDANAAKWYPSY